MVEVCPVDCIHPSPDESDHVAVETLYIDPEECIDRDACVDAIFAEDQLPEEWQKFTQINADGYATSSASQTGGGSSPTGGVTLGSTNEPRRARRAQLNLRQRPSRCHPRPKPSRL